MWTEQDSIWSGYTFRHLPVDRKWRDRLCRQAVDIARMLQTFKRFDEALKVVNRGIQYGAGEDVIARARVFASYYSFCTQDSEDAIVLAGDALSYESLSDKDKARAYHVLGLGYTDIYQKTRELSDLDAAIEALNSSVRIAPSNREVKKLLKTLRVERQKLASKPAS
jgi:tetratricopeptide (TPR) repeat protein